MMNSTSTIEIPPQDVLRAFDVPGPRYTSYPTADRFAEGFGAESFAGALAHRARDAAAPPLSLYVHLPFCDTVCYYCACNKIVTRHHGRAPDYINAVLREAELVAAHLSDPGAPEPPPLPIEQLHLGGGTPTFLSNEELADLIGRLTARFPLTPNGEYGVEVDPRSTPPDKVYALALLGFNRMSVGVQDFDERVQRAVNRIQSFEMTRATIEAARHAGFRSVNLDLIYGLPLQTRKSFDATLDRVLEIAPDRVALYHYAHLPERFKPQRRIDVADLPAPAEKAAIMLDAIERLTAAGYRYVGMDHFAREDDDLARAQARGRLHRNFQGYSTRAECDLIGLGVSAISKLGPTYSQNLRALDEYYDALAAGSLPTARGVMLNRDDVLRRAVIMGLMCQFVVSKEAVNEAHLVDFDQHFAVERAALKPFIDAGLVEETPEWITITPRGKLLVRAVAMVFDRYLQIDREMRERTWRYSKVV
jgi:oxygen-independent coproporphyrinogen-3 oxidase